MAIFSLPKVDGSSTQPGLEMTGFMTEAQNVISGTGQTPSGADLNQVGKGIATYAAGGEYYVDTGSANAYVLGVVGGKQAPAAYFDGMRIRFIPANNNTGASTVNVAGLGVKNIKTNIPGTIDPAPNYLHTTKYVELIYRNSGGGFFVLMDQDAVPVGTIIDFGAASTPIRFLACNSAAVSRTTYAALFAEIGTTWGPGDGSTTFNLPPPRHTKIGAGGTAIVPPANTVGSVGGSEEVTIGENNLTTHSHQIYLEEVEVQAGTGEHVLSSNQPGSPGEIFNTRNTGDEVPIAIVQPSMVVNMCIKY